MGRVVWSKKVNKELDRIPHFIADKFQAWVKAVEETGLLETKKLPGLHDEPLKGEREGQRSVRLNKAYRAIYKEKRSGQHEVIEVMEVTKHEY